MKKLVSKDFTIDPGRLFLPIAQSLEHIQEAVGETEDAMMVSSLGGAPILASGGHVLYGCFDSVSAGNHSVGAGAIYYFLNSSAWSSLTNYALYDLVSKNGNEYVSLIAGNLNHDPETAPTYWIRVGGHLTGQIFNVDAVVLNALANTVVAKIVPTYASTDPTAYTDGTTANVHAIFKIAFFDAASGTGIADYADLLFLNKWKTYTPTLTADDGVSPVVGGFTGTALMYYNYNGSTMKIRVSVILVAILATVKNLYFTIPKTPFNPAGDGVPISPYNVNGFNLAKRSDISNSSHIAVQVSMGLRHNGSGTQLAVAKLDGTAFAASASGTIDFEITLGWRKDSE